MFPLIKSFLGVQGAIFQKTPLAAGGKMGKMGKMGTVKKMVPQTEENSKRKSTSKWGSIYLGPFLLFYSPISVSDPLIIGCIYFEITGINRSDSTGVKDGDCAKNTKSYPPFD